MGKKITRSRKNKVIEGVCGGIAEYFDIDPTIVRLGFVISMFFGGTGIIAYIVAVIVIPMEDKYVPENFYNEKEEFKTVYDEEKDFSTTMEDSEDEFESGTDRNKKFIGLGLIVLGGLFLLREIIPLRLGFPALLIIIGSLIIFKGGRSSS
ncbi:PspC domain-containing protein [Herbivorax sp. ANBcel31]|uniref:PspC domain-containing protein n=1 Tax=Herbivorax sp. ANBcel31 TaxID=3069754 RepID=UPI0027B00937|nr:PspC domain-containing protein [Herbivorax sp. ANBcel31]MDQ2086292.1 PspC domain-containing protein [Herbivorax sp. ANBcel31]